MITTGIIGAMEIEITKIREKMTSVIEKKISRVTFYIGRFGGGDIVLARSGVGKVNAALCAHTMAREFGVSAIINTGIAGGLAKGLNVGDVVISAKVCHHDFDTTFFGDDKPGEIFFDGVGRQFFEADEPLINLALEAGKLACPDKNVVTGVIASGDQFVHDNERRKFITDTFGASCVEMESGAIAQACFLNEIPFVIIRAISDNADGEAFESFEKFGEDAANNAALITEHMIKRWASDEI